MVHGDVVRGRGDHRRRAARIWRLRKRVTRSLLALDSHGCGLLAGGGSDQRATGDGGHDARRRRCGTAYDGYGKLERNGINGDVQKIPLLTLEAWVLTAMTEEVEVGGDLDRRPAAGDEEGDNAAAIPGSPS